MKIINAIYKHNKRMKGSVILHQPRVRLPIKQWKWKSENHIYFFFQKVWIPEMCSMEAIKDMHKYSSIQESVQKNQS